MNNNDVLKRIRYSFDFNDATMINIFAQAETEVSREQVSNWLKKDDDPAFAKCNDHQLALFLNGLIVRNRGRKEGPLPEAERRLSNNIIFRKLKIALDLKDDDILQLMQLADFRLSKHELSAFFRNKEHKHYRECHDQVLRNFLKGIQLHYRADTGITEAVKEL